MPRWSIFLAKLSLRAIAPAHRQNLETGGIDGEHAFIGGGTGFGKSYLEKQLLLEAPFAIVHDPKGTFTIRRAIKRVQHVRQLYGLDPKKHPFVVYSPPRGEDRDEGEQEAFCDFIYQRGNCYAAFDELTAICTATWAPESLKDLYARGRERGVCCVGLSQQPVGVYPLCMSQARHLYAFYLANAAHREKLAGFMPLEPELIGELQRYEFYYWREDLPVAAGPFILPPPGKGGGVQLATA